MQIVGKNAPLSVERNRGQFVVTVIQQRRFDDGFKGGFGGLFYPVPSAMSPVSAWSVRAGHYWLAVLPDHGVLAQTPLFVQRLGNGLSERFQLLLAFRRGRYFFSGFHHFFSFAISASNWIGFYNPDIKHGYVMA